MIRYVVTTWANREDVNLSRLGSWGNIRHSSAQAARDAAREDAKGKPYTIDQERGRRAPMEGN